MDDRLGCAEVEIGAQESGVREWVCFAVVLVARSLAGGFETSMELRSSYKRTDNLYFGAAEVWRTVLVRSLGLVH